jgi:MscS family membrane protein
VKIARVLLPAVAVLVGILLCCTGSGIAADAGPLNPLDTSSPRATLQGFNETIDGIYAELTDLFEGYGKSDRLYLTSQERQEQINLLRRTPKAIRALDISGISPVLQDTVPVERALQLKEILDRIELPPLADIPDQETMARLQLRRWRLPGTEIDFVQMRDGPRAGEYVVSAETVDRLPEFYAKVANLPYKPDAAKQLNEVFQRLSWGGTSTLYEAFASSPAGLAAIVPPRWMLNLPVWSRVPLAGVSAWQWLGLSIGLLSGVLVIFACHRLARRRVDRGEEQPGVSWRALPVPVSINLVAAFLVPFLCAVFRISGTTRVILAFTQTMAFYLSAAWLSIIGLIILGDIIVSSEHLKRSNLDSQLVRLGARLVGVFCAIAFLIRGADDLGFPAYSVLAGLGVGGLAVALAARDSIANLLGSMFIMLEKPFRIGHIIRVGGSEGTVEDVGFRSTRIRTPDNSLISIPNNTVVNTIIENVSLRAMRRQRLVLQIIYDTPREKVEALIDGVGHLILTHPMTNKTNYQVRFNNFSECSLDILVLFHLEVPDLSAELRERETILLQTMDLMSELGIAFAFPTRTLHIVAAPPEAHAVDAAMSPWAASKNAAQREW